MASTDDEDLNGAEVTRKRPPERLRHRAGHGAASRVSAMAELVLCAAVAMLTGMVCAWTPVAAVRAEPVPQTCPGFVLQLDGSYGLWSVTPFQLEKLTPGGAISLEAMESVWKAFTKVAPDPADELNPGYFAPDGYTLMSTIEDVGSDPAGTHVITLNRFRLTVGDVP